MSTLDDGSRARVAHTVSQVKALTPELVPFIKELHEVGLIDGWRDVVYCGPILPEPAGVTVGQMALESVSETKERMKRGAH